MRPATLAALGMCLVLALVLTALEFPASFPAWLGWFVPVALAFVNERDTAGVLPDAFLP